MRSRKTRAKGFAHPRVEKWAIALSVVGLTVVGQAQAQENGAGAIERFWSAVWERDYAEMAEALHADDRVRVVSSLRSLGQSALDLILPWWMEEDAIEIRESTDADLLRWFLKTQFDPYAIAAESGDVPIEFVGSVGWAEEGRAVLRLRVDGDGSPLAALMIQPTRLEGSEWRALLPAHHAKMAGLPGLDLDPREADLGGPQALIETFANAIAASDWATAAELVHPDDVVRAGAAARGLATESPETLDLAFGLSVEEASRLSERELAGALLAHGHVQQFPLLAHATGVYAEGLVRDGDTTVLVYSIDVGWTYESQAVPIELYDGALRLRLIAADLWAQLVDEPTPESDQRDG